MTFSAFLYLLTLVLVIAKLSGAIAVSWWIVFLPVIPAIIFMIIGMLIISIAAGGSASRRRRF